MHTQLQIRRNAQDVQDYVQDLFAWENEVKRKQSQRKDAQQPSAPTATHPAIRGRAGGSVASPPAALQQPAARPRNEEGAVNVGTRPGRRKSDQDQPPAAHTYQHYAKWDRFDVDAALADSQEDPARGNERTAHARAAESPSSAPAPPRGQSPPAARAGTLPESPAPPGAAAAAAAAGLTSGSASAGGSSASAATKGAGRAPATHEEWRERGNALFQAREYSEASACYSRSIALQPTPQAHGNRALAALREGRPGDAEADCDAALALDPGYVKAHHRRGMARMALGRPLEAAADFEAGLRREPTNAALGRERASALAAALAAEGIAPSATPAPAALRVVLEGEAGDAAAAHDGAPAAAQPPGGRGGRAGISELPATARAAVPTTTADARLSEALPAPPAVTPLAPALPQAAATSGALQSAAASSVRALQPPAASPVVVKEEAAAREARASSERAPPAREGGVGSSVAESAVAAAAVAVLRRPPQLKSPRSSVDFDATWRACGGDLELQAQYMRLLQPEQLGSLFKSSLTSGVLVGMARTALAALAAPPAAGGDAALSLDAAHAVALLAALPSVPRFGMVVMCLTRSEREALRSAWGTVRQEAAAALQGLRAQFKL